MTQVLDDLNIFSNKPEADWIRGEFIYAVFDDDPKESFIITIDEKIGVDDHIITLCHELEHYYVTKAILELGIMSEADMQYSSDGKGNLVRCLPYEGAHSNPSHHGQSKISNPERKI